MVGRVPSRESLERLVGTLSVVLGAGTLYAAWGSLPVISEPMVACEMNPAGRPRLNPDWTTEYYNACHAHDGAYTLLAVLTLVGMVLLANGYLLLTDGRGPSAQSEPPREDDSVRPPLLLDVLPHGVLTDNPPGVPTAATRNSPPAENS
jgi:hypothetical protein